MKRSLLRIKHYPAVMLLIFQGITMSISAQESKLNNQIYQKNKEAVFFISQAIYLDEAKIDHIELFQRLEKSMDVKLLNHYVPIVTGSAFLINSEGYFISAAHVLQYYERNDAIDSAKWIFEEYISRECIPGYLTRSELRTVFQDYVKAIKGTPLVIMMRSMDQIDYIAELVDENYNDDLALLKIDMDQEISPVFFGSDEPIKVGSKVFTIGYPLQFVMDTFLDDFKPTLTDGIISAIRNDKWDLQHTASINSGNSGGPLFGEGGQLIGINLGAISDANDIYFSTSSQKILDWLEDIGMADIATGEVIE